MEKKKRTVPVTGVTLLGGMLAAPHLIHSCAHNVSSGVPDAEAAATMQPAPSTHQVPKEVQQLQQLGKYTKEHLTPDGKKLTVVVGGATAALNARRAETRQPGTIAR